jgi:GLPGLI family protein
MNTYIAFIFSFLFFSNNSAAQKPHLIPASTFICTYQLSYQPDTVNKIIRKENLQLLISNGKSRFQSQSSRSRDSLTSFMASSVKNPRVMEFLAKQILLLPPTKFRYIIYKFPTANQITCYDWIGNTLYQYKEPVPLKWIISTATASIAGYACQRATTSFAGRIFEAWFTREIPISDGPYKFCGLPGLIVKVNDTRKQYVFELTQLRKSVNVLDISMPTKKITSTTKSDLWKGQAAYNLSVVDRLAATGSNISRETLHKMRKPINPLELR